jgi:hypothetical protein
VGVRYLDVPIYLEVGGTEIFLDLVECRKGRVLSSVNEEF